MPPRATSVLRTRLADVLPQDRRRDPSSPIEIDCDVLTAPGIDLRIVVYTVAPGSEAASRMDLLRVTGTQALTPR